MLINNSRLATYLDCPRKYYWGYVYDGTGLVRTVHQEALVFGTWVHAMLAAHYAEQDWKAVGPGSAIPEFAQMSDMDRERWGTTFDWATRLVGEYIKWAASNDKFSVLEVESEGFVTLGSICYRCGRPYPEGGAEVGSGAAGALPPACAKCHAEVHHLAYKTDLIVNEGGNVFPIDHKTTGGIGATYLASWYYSPQMYLYHKGVKKNHPSANRFQMNFLRKAKQVGLTETKQCQSCRNGVKKRVGCEPCGGEGKTTVPAVEPPPFHRPAPVSIQPEIMDRVEISRIRACNSIREEESKSLEDEPLTTWEMRPDKCFAFGRCPFIDLCWSPAPADRWHAPTEDLLEGYLPRPADYVTLAREEDV